MQNDKDSIVFEKFFQLLFYFILLSALSEKLQITKIEFLKKFSFIQSIYSQVFSL